MVSLFLALNLSFLNLGLNRQTYSGSREAQSLFGKVDVWVSKNWGLLLIRERPGNIPYLGVYQP